MIFASSLADMIPVIAALVIGLSVHEYAHARSAFAFGDTTAYDRGRMTLNPAKHIDPLGALVFVLVGFGWARPVPINPYFLGRQGTLVVAAAGPASNVLLAFLALAPIRFGLVPATALGPLAAFVVPFLAIFAVLNVMLAVFNMLPIAPLDGWRVLMGVVPEQTADRLLGYEQLGGIVLMAIIVAGRIGNTSILGAILDPFISVILTLVAGPELASQLRFK